MPSDLHRTVLGEGPTLLCAGGIHLDHRYLRPWLDPLAEHDRLVYFDHRGTGDSPRPGDWSGVDHESWARDIEELRADLGGGPVFLFGHSYGAFLALEYALRFQDRLRGLILCAAAPAMDYPEIVMANAAERGTPEQIEALPEAFGAAATDDEALHRVWMRILPLYFHRFDAGTIAEWDDPALYSAAAYNHAFGRCLPAYDVTDRLGEIDVPALVLSGRHDWITPVAEGGQRVAEGLPAADLVVFERSGHFPFVEERDEFLETVSSWIGRTGPRRTEPAA